MNALSGFGVITLITGTMINPASIQKAPALIGERNISGKSGRMKIFAVMTTLENMKLTQHESLLTPFQ